MTRGPRFKRSETRSIFEEKAQGSHPLGVELHPHEPERSMLDHIKALSGADQSFQDSFTEVSLLGVRARLLELIDSGSRRVPLQVVLFRNGRLGNGERIGGITEDSSF